MSDRHERGSEAETGEQKETPSVRRVVRVSLAVDLLDIVSNLVVALLTGSAVIFAEGAERSWWTWTWTCTRR